MFCILPTVCDHLLDDFEGHVNMGITAYNSLGGHTITLEECKHKCVINQECMSFEHYEKLNLCHMSRVSREMLLDSDPTAFSTSSPGWSVYSRQCGKISATGTWPWYVKTCSEHMLQLMLKHIDKCLIKTFYSLTWFYCRVQYEHL